MAKNTSISSENLSEQEKHQKSMLIDELKKGEESGFLTDLKSDSFLNELHQKHTGKASGLKD